MTESYSERLNNHHLTPAIRKISAQLAAYQEPLTEIGRLMKEADQRLLSKLILERYTDLGGTL